MRRILAAVDDALIGRVEFANPYHDARGRFAPKGAGSRVPTKGLDGHSGGDVPAKTSIATKTAPAKTTDLPDRGVLAEPAMDADTIARYEQAASEHAVGHASRNEKKGEWGISAVVGFGVSRHEVDKIREAYATGTPTQESFEFNETMRNWPSEYVTTYRGVKGEADPAFWQSRVGQTLEWNAPTPTSLDPVRGAGSPSSTIGDVSTDLDDPRSVGLVFEVKGYGRVLGGPPVSVARDHQVVMPPGRYTVESVAHARIPLSGRNDRQKPVLVVTIRNDRDVSSEAGWDLHGKTQTAPKDVSPPIPFPARTGPFPGRTFAMSDAPPDSEDGWDRYVGEPGEIIWADDKAELALVGRVQFASRPSPTPPPNLIGRVQGPTSKSDGRRGALAVFHGRVEFANPYHDGRGRFTTKNEARVARLAYDKAKAGLEAHLAANPLSTTDANLRYDQLGVVMSEFGGPKSPLNTSSLYNGRGPDGDRWDPARTAKQREAVGEIMKQVRESGIPQDREDLILGGLPGSGKSYSLRPGQKADELGVRSWEYGKDITGATHVSVNADIMKEVMVSAGMVPEIEGMKPMEMASFIHKESSRMAKMLLQQLRREGYNVTIDGTLGDDSRDKIEPLINEGYRAKGLFVDVPLDESLGSARDRYTKDAFTENGGRYVPPFVQAAGAPPAHGRMSENRNVFDRLAGITPDGQVTGDGLFETFLVIDNTGIANGNPRSEKTVEGTGSGANPWAGLPPLPPERFTIRRVVRSTVY